MNETSEALQDTGARAAYEAFSVYVGRDDMPGWADLPRHEREAWDAATTTARMAASAEGFARAKEMAARLVESADDGVPLQMLADDSIRAMQDDGAGEAVLPGPCTETWQGAACDLTPEEHARYRGHRGTDGEGRQFVWMRDGDAWKTYALHGGVKQEGGR